MTVKECSPTEKFKAYQGELDLEKQSKNPARVDRAKCELELMLKSRFTDINGIVHHYHISGPESAEETVMRAEVRPSCSCLNVLKQLQN